MTLVVVRAEAVQAGEPRWWVASTEEWARNAIRCGELTAGMLHLDRPISSIERLAVVDRHVDRTDEATAPSDALTRAGRRIVNDAVAALFGAIDPDATGYGYGLHRDGPANAGRLRLSIELTFDVAALNQFADALSLSHGPPVATCDEPWPATVTYNDNHDGEG